MSGTIILWNPQTGTRLGKILKSHQKFITSLSWQPMHLSGESKLLASSSKDCTIKIWNAITYELIQTFSGYTANVTKIIWGGEGMIYGASEDRTIKVWKENGELVRELKGHGHWVNFIAVNTEYALKVGCFDEKDQGELNYEDMEKISYEKYQKVTRGNKERLISASDDCTLFLWNPTQSEDPLARLTGHNQPVNHCNFSPDGHYILSASFDKSLKLWDGFTGKYICTFLGHVGAVYQCCWSIDCRMVISCSKDSTVKVWDIKERKLQVDLPGHSDEVYAVDWAVDGEKVVTGGKDRLVKIWKN